MNSNKIYSLILVLLLFAVSSCKDNEDKEKVPVLISNDIEITLKPGEWVYYRFSDSTVVGTGIIGDNDDDAMWYKRTDWDIAFSEGGIRTNGGTAGRGIGGISIIDEETFNQDSYTDASLLYYYQDVSNVPITVPVDR